MRKGKCVAQAAHASLGVTLENLEHPNIKEWLSGRFTKIAVSVESLEELEHLVDKASEVGVPTKIIVDSGLTEFHGVPTVTCAAIGPALSEVLDPITGHLKLM